VGHKLGLAEEIDRRLHLLKCHLPYHESDYVLTLAYNALLGASGSKTLRCAATMKPFWTVMLQLSTGIKGVCDNRMR
jgi:hypothetical protein